jgi:hypothetical protein
MVDEKHVFVAYRQHMESLARKVAIYLEKNDLKTWFFPWRIGWGDSVTSEEEKGISRSFAGLIIYTPDFLEGRTAKEEYRALAAKKREDPAFKLGVLRVGCSQETVPAFLKDYFSAALDSKDDDAFVREMGKIRRGLCGLPYESSEEFNQIYDFALSEWGFNMFESEALDFVDYWYEKLAKFDFATFQRIYRFALQNFFSECDEHRDESHPLLSKDFALMLMENSPQNGNYETVLEMLQAYQERYEYANNWDLLFAKFKFILSHQVLFNELEKLSKRRDRRLWERLQKHIEKAELADKMELTKESTQNKSEKDNPPNKKAHDSGRQTTLA